MVKHRQMSDMKSLEGVIYEPLGKSWQVIYLLCTTHTIIFLFRLLVIRCRVLDIGHVFTTMYIIHMKVVHTILFCAPGNILFQAISHTAPLRSRYLSCYFKIKRMSSPEHPYFLQICNKDIWHGGHFGGYATKQVCKAYLKTCLPCRMS